MSERKERSVGRAILRYAAILLLDEVTSALDDTTERQVLGNIVTKQPNKTCIVTTHRPSGLNLCQRVYRIMETKVMELDEDESFKDSDGLYWSHTVLSGIEGNNQLKEAFMVVLD